MKFSASVAAAGFLIVFLLITDPKRPMHEPLYAGINLMTRPRIFFTTCHVQMTTASYGEHLYFRASVRHRHGSLRQILQRGHGVLRMLQVGDQVGRSTTGVSFNVRILHDGLVKLEQRLREQCSCPPVVLTSISARGALYPMK